jgi:RND superfamily putative drug exporter
MVIVFAAFVLTGLPTIKEIGVGLACAIAIDATVTRLVLVPATMRLLGEWNWWLPEWLNRRLPHIAHETRRPLASR